MWPALVMALVGARQKRNEEKRMLNNQIHQQEADTKAAIADRRAARAGDSGYMQLAARGMANMPQRSGDSGNQLLSAVGQALASQSTDSTLSSQNGRFAGGLEGKNFGSGGGIESSANTTAPQLRGVTQYLDPEEERRRMGLA